MNDRRHLNGQMMLCKGQAIRVARFLGREDGKVVGSRTAPLCMLCGVRMYVLGQKQK